VHGAITNGSTRAGPLTLSVGQALPASSREAGVKPKVVLPMHPDMAER